jgi:multicomponent Na+:H+ antiporter subunit A
VASVFTFIYSFRFVVELPFQSARADRSGGPEHSPHGLDRWLLVGPPMVLCAGTIVLGVGLFKGFTQLQHAIDGFVLGVGEFLVPHAHYHFALWHGVGFPLKMTGIVVGTGFLFYLLLPVMRGFWSELSRIPGPETVNRLFQDNLVGMAEGFMSIFTRGPLPKYLRIMLSFILIVMALSWFDGSPYSASFSLVPLTLVTYEWIPFVLVILGALGMLGFKKPVPAVIALGVVGFLVSTVYLVYRAPDLIMTQIAVETVSIVIFLWVLKDIDFMPVDRSLPRGLDLVIAFFAGAGSVYFLLQNLGRKEGYSMLAEYYFTHSLPEAWGANMVNVILVDFRALDTLGEISVLGIATVGILALLKVTFARKPSGEGT